MMVKWPVELRTKSAFRFGVADLRWVYCSIAARPCSAADARAAIGYAAATLRAAMNSRRLMAIPPEGVGQANTIGGGTSLARACCRASSRGRVGAWASFDDFVGLRKKCLWHAKTKSFCSLEIDHQFEFGWLLHGEVGRFCSL
jgi:hypothetical protein